MYTLIEHNKIVGDKNFKFYNEDEFITLVRQIGDALEVSNIPSIEIFESDSPIGYCEGIIKKGVYAPVTLGFNKQLLDGKSYSELQVIETINHELAHLEANRRHNSDCGHDERWKKVAVEFGCNPEENLCLMMITANVTIKEFLGTEKRIYPYYLICDKCGEEILKSRDNLINILGLFLLSNEENPFPLSLGNVGIKSRCCNSPYRFIGEINKTIDILEKEKQLFILKETLKNMV